MTWQLLLVCYLVLGTASYLVRRRLAVVAPQHNRLINWLFYLFLYPTGLVVAYIEHPNLLIGWENLGFLIIGEAAFPIVTYLAYRASKGVDAGLFTITSNLTPVITIATAWLLLHEGLSPGEFLGASIILISAVVVSLPSLTIRSSALRIGLLFAIASIVLSGLAITFERFMLTRMDFGTYLVYGWGMQTFWMTVIAWPERRRLASLKQKKLVGLVTGYVLANTFKGLCFVSALRLSGNASRVAGFSSFLAVLVVFAAYVVLDERRQFWLKLSGAFFGVIGLIVLNTT